MKSYQLIHQLLDFVEEAENENNGAEVSLRDFTGFLLSKASGAGGDYVTGEVRFGQEATVSQELAFQLDNNIGRLFVYMSRYAKSYIKKALDGTLMQTGEDFTALAVLLTHKSLSKSELISHNLQEKASGSEVIRRLIAAGLVEQWDNADDKRVKQIGITEAGRQLLYTVFVDMSYVGKMITGDLSTPEKMTLQYLLQKLENFHREHHEKKTIASKADLKTFTEQQAKS